MFKKLFRIGSTLKSPIEPIFPMENYSIFKLTIDNSPAFATINTGYNDYPNKIIYPWYAEIIIDINNKNDNGHPTNEEAEILNQLEEQITGFLKQTQTVHPIGRVTRNGERDIFYYIDEPNFDKKKIKDFFDSINTIRPMNFTLKEDKKWSNVGAFIK
jgi:hypothetical protein